MAQPPGQRHAGVTEPAHQRAERQDGGAHGAHKFIGSLGVGDFARFDGEAGRRHVGHLDVRVHVRKQPAHGDDVAHARNVFKMHGLGGQQSRGHCRQCRVFRAADGHRALESSAAFNPKLVHGVLSSAALMYRAVSLLCDAALSLFIQRAPQPAARRAKLAPRIGRGYASLQHNQSDAQTSRLA